MVDIVKYILVIFALLTVYYRIKNFHSSNFIVGMRMTTLIFISLWVFSLLFNNNDSLSLLDKTYQIILNSIKTMITPYDLFMAMGVNNYYTFLDSFYMQPICLLFVFYGALSSLSLILSTKQSHSLLSIYVKYIFNFKQLFFALILFVLHGVFYNYLMEFRILYSYILIIMMCICIAGVYTFVGGISSILTFLVMLSILISGFDPLTGISSLWNTLFEIVDIKNNTFKVLVLFVTIVSSSWDNMLRALIGNTMFYKRINEFFLDKLSS